MTVWYRVLYSSGREESVAGLAELERVVGRKAPRVIWFAEAIIHQCQICGTAGPWGPGWIAWRRYNERWDERGEGTDVYCSEACAKAENPDRRWPEWMDVNDEPCPAEVNRAKNRARWRERDRKRGTVSHRKVPMPEWPGKGHCSWCAGKLDKAVDGRAISWHKACFPIYELHSRLEAQFYFLIERDGQRCAWLGCDETHGLEVDHRVPLWSVDLTLPLDELRWFYGPGNLWLLCGRHHKAKTKREAARRAYERRLIAAQLALPLAARP